MTIYVTGAESFIGKVFCRLCDSYGREYLGIDAAAPRGHPKIVKADIRDINIADLVPNNAEALVHLAALSSDQRCKGNAYECFDINVMGTLNMVNAARRKSVRQFIFSSTEWVYDSFSDTPKEESSVIQIDNLNSEYALSKVVSEQNLRQQYSRGFCPTTLLRLGIIYGPRKSNWSAVENIFFSVAEKKRVEVGSLNTARQFIHVVDVAKAIYSTLGLNGFVTVNIQGNRLVSLGEIIKKSKEIWNVDPEVFESNPDTPSIRSVSTQLAQELLTWEPIIGLDDGLRSLREDKSVTLIDDNLI